MRPQTACMNRCKVALATFRRFSPVLVFLWFLKSPEVTYAKSHCLHLYDFFQNYFSDVSSNCLYEQIECCIGYIYTIFPQSEFSYGSSSRLKLQMKSHIVYICTIFLQIEFSNASSNCLYEQMQSYIG